MRLQRTTEGLEIHLRPRGVGRLFSAAFLCVWLCGWIAGEAFALWVLLGGAARLVTGEIDSSQLAPLLLAGLFLLLWLALWTLGGYAAWCELLRLVSSEDRIVARHDGLVLHRRLGPFRSTRSIPRAALRGIYAIARRCRVLAEAAEGRVELTSLARGAECESLVAALRAELGLRAEGPEARAGLPEGWQEVADAEGGSALVKDEAVRRTRARVAWGFTAVCALVALPFVARIQDDREALPAALGLCAVTVALAWGSWRVARTRLEWRIEPGLLRLRRRSAQRVNELFEARALELVESADSDGDAWFTLYAVAAGAPPSHSPPTFSDRKVRRRIAREMDDPTVPRRLGAWIAGRSGIPLADRATSEHKAIELAALIARLETGGRFSRWIARRIGRV